jgi:hypothetical protein
MLDLAATADVAYPHIVRGIKKGHLGAVATHQSAQVIGFPGIAAQQPVRIQLPEIARLRDQRSRQQSGVKVVEGIRTIVLKIGEDRIDLRRLKTGHRDVEPIFEQELGQAEEFLRQAFAIPAGVLCDAVVGKQKRAFAGLGQAVDHNGGDGLECEQLGGFEPPVTGEQSPVLIDQDRGGEANRLNAFGNLADLFPGMRTGVARMRLDVRERDRADRTNVSR